MMTRLISTTPKPRPRLEISKKPKRLVLKVYFTWQYFSVSPRMSQSDVLLLPRSV